MLLPVGGPWACRPAQDGPAYRAARRASTDRENAPPSYAISAPQTLMAEQRVIAPAVRSSRIKRPRPVRRFGLFVRPKLCQPRRCQSAPAPRRDRDPARGAIPTACVAPSKTSCRATSDRRQERSSFFHRATALGFISRLGANPIRLPADLTRTRSRGPQGYRSAPKSPRRIGRRLRPAAAAGGCPTSSSAAQSKSRRPLS